MPVLAALPQRSLNSAWVGSQSGFVCGEVKHFWPCWEVFLSARPWRGDGADRAVLALLLCGETENFGPRRRNTVADRRSPTCTACFLWGCVSFGLRGMTWWQGMVMRLYHIGHVQPSSERDLHADLSHRNPVIDTRVWRMRGLRNRIRCSRSA